MRPRYRPRSDAAAEATPAGPSASSHILRDAESLLVIVAHLAVGGFCLYGAAIEIVQLGGGVAWVYILGALVSAGGAWYAAVAFVRRQWRAVAVPFLTGPALFALIVVLMAATWSRAGP